MHKIFYTVYTYFMVEYISNHAYFEVNIEQKILINMFRITVRLELTRTINSV